jgi:hypothetical protein
MEEDLAVQTEPTKAELQYENSLKIPELKTQLESTYMNAAVEELHLIRQIEGLEVKLKAAASKREGLAQQLTGLSGAQQLLEI